MGKTNPTTPDKCEHKKDPGECVQCNPIFKGVKVPPRRKEGGK